MRSFKYNLQFESKIDAKITIGETEYTDRKEAAKALEDAVLAIKYADTPVKVGSFQGFDLTVTVNSNMMGASRIFL